MNRTDDKGAAMLLVLVLIVIFAFLGGAFVFSSTFEAVQSVEYGQRRQAYYLARSGVEIAYQWVSDCSNYRFVKNEGHVYLVGDFGEIGMQSVTDA